MRKNNLGKRIFTGILAAVLVFTSEGSLYRPYIALQSDRTVEAAEEIVPKEVITNATVYSVLKILVNAKKANVDFYGSLADPDTTDITTIPAAQTYLNGADITREELMSYTGTVNFKPYSLTGSDLTGISYASKLSELVLPDTVTDLPVNICKNMTGLATVRMSKNMKTVSAGAFEGCEALETIMLYDDTALNQTGRLNLSAVTSIGNSAFQDCRVFSKVSFHEDLERLDSNAFENAIGLTEVRIPNKGGVENGTRLGTGVFKGCRGLETVSFAEGRKEITSALFSNASTFGMDITFPSSLEYIGTYAFEDSSIDSCNLTTTNLQTIDRFAFEGTVFLDAFDLSGVTTLTTIGEGAFYGGIFADAAVVLPNSLQKLGRASFASSNILSIRIPDLLERIEDGTFANTAYLSTVIISSGNTKLTAIGDYAFALDGRLTDTRFLANATKLDTIGAYAFAYCNILDTRDETDATTGKTKIITFVAADLVDGTDDEYRVKGLSEVVIPDSVTTLGENAFLASAAIQKITLSKNLTVIPENAFAIDDASNNAFPSWASNIVLEEKEEGEGKLTLYYTAANFEPLAPLADASAELAVCISSGTTEIASGAFMNRRRLMSLYSEDVTKENKKLLFPSGLVGIGDSAFSGCSYYVSDTSAEAAVAEKPDAPVGFSEIDLPGTLAVLGANAFANDYSLKNVVFAENQVLEEIGAAAFSTCVAEDASDEDNSIYYGLQSANIDNLKQLKVIASGAFFGDKYLSLPKEFSGTLTEIGDSAFEGVEYTKELVFNYHLESIGSRAFALAEGDEHIGLSKLDFSTAVKLTTIGQSAFAYHSSLLEANMTKTILTAVEKETFLGCSAMTSFLAPDTLERIEDDSFKEAESLKSFRVPVTASLSKDTFGKDTNPPSLLTFVMGRFRTDPVKLPLSQAIRVELQAFDTAATASYKRWDDQKEAYIEIDEEDPYYFAWEDPDDRGIFYLRAGSVSEEVLDTTFQVTGILQFSSGSTTASVDIPVEIVNVAPETIEPNSSGIVGGKLETNENGEAVTPYVVHVSSTNIGGAITLGANVLPGTVTYDVDYRLSNTSVLAPVDASLTNANAYYSGIKYDGISDPEGYYTSSKQFTVLSEGAVSVEIGYTDGGVFYPKTTLTVLVENPITSIDYTINETGVATGNIDLLVGNTLQISAIPAFADDAAIYKDKLQYKTNKPEIATVDVTGKITAIAVGTAVITVESATGSRSEKITVNVKEDASEVAPAVIELTGESYMNTNTAQVFTATTLPTAAVSDITWSVSNEEIAGITPNGNTVAVLAKKAGTFTLTAASALKTSVKKSMLITVVDAASSIRFLNDSISIEQGNISSFAFVSNESATNGFYRNEGSSDYVTFSVANPAVATLSSSRTGTYAGTLRINRGNVFIKGVGEGTTTLTASTANGLTASMTLVITGNVITAISLPSTAEVEVGKTVTLTPTVTPANSPEGYTFASSNELIATVDANGVVTGVGVGRVNITVTSKIKAVKATCRVTVTAAQTTDTKQDGTTTGSTDGDSGLAKGKKTTISGAVYTSNGNGTMTYTNPSVTKFAVSIPATVKVSGKTYPVTKIAAGAFKGNKTLKKVTIGNNVQSIGKAAFQNCSALTTVKLGKKVSAIGANAFAGCGKLKSVTLDAALTSIGNKAFANCKALKKITIPKKVTKIGKAAFAGCSKLKSVTIKTAKLKTIGKKAFAAIAKGAKFKCPKKQLKSYKKLLKKSGLPKKAKVK